MSVYKEKDSGTWSVHVYFSDWKGEQQHSHKRGFKTKREATEWERDFLCRHADDLKMTFGSFYEVYSEDIRPKLKLNTWLTKESIIKDKILPYFEARPMNEITSRDILKWQTELIEFRNEKGRGFSQTYLKTIHNQLTAIFNHAFRFYGLKTNPTAKAGSMGKKNADEMKFWTREEYAAFAKVAMAYTDTYFAFEVLYWTGMRLGEMLALTYKDVDFKKKTIRISKSYQFLRGEEVITDPKTPKSKRTVNIPDFLCLELKQYAALQYKGLKPDDRMFSQVNKSLLSKRLQHHSEKAGLQRINVHGLRHSHISYLIDLGFTALAIAERSGHESIEITLRYAHLFPNKQTEMVERLDLEEGYYYGQELNRKEQDALQDSRLQVFGRRVHRNAEADRALRNAKAGIPDKIIAFPGNNGFRESAPLRVSR